MKKSIAFFLEKLLFVFAIFLIIFYVYCLFKVYQFERIIEKKENEPSSCFFNKYKLESTLLDSIQKISIIVRVKTDTSGCSQHNNALMAILQQREASNIDWVIAKEDGIKQVRNFYLALLVVAITLILSKKVNKRKKYFIITLIGIPLIFILDVHQEDLLNVQCIYYNIHGNAVDSMMKMYPNNTVLYNINYTEIESARDSARDLSRRLLRKFFLTCKLNFDRMVYYQIPWILISTLIIYNSCKKKKRKSKDRGSSKPFK